MIPVTRTLPQLAVLPDAAAQALERLARLPWSHSLLFSVYGARIGIRSNDRAALESLLPLLPPHARAIKNPQVDWLYSLYVAKPSAGKRMTYSFYGNAERFTRTRDISLVYGFFEREVQLAIAQAARGKVFIHAGVVGWKGQAILIPGRSYSGKSTLVRELVRAGAVYYSDEYAVLDAQARVYPFARPVSLRDEKQVNQKLPFAALGGVIGTKPLPVGMVVVARYRAGAKWRPKTLSPGMGALELLANAVTARTHQLQVLEAVSAVASHATILKGVRGEAAILARALLAAATFEIPSPPV